MPVSALTILALARHSCGAHWPARSLPASKSARVSTRSVHRITARVQEAWIGTRSVYRAAVAVPAPSSCSCSSFSCTGSCSFGELTWRCVHQPRSGVPQRAEIPPRQGQTDDLRAPQTPVSVAQKKYPKANCPRTTVVRFQENSRVKKKCLEHSNLLGQGNGGECAPSTVETRQRVRILRAFSRSTGSAARCRSACDTTTTISWADELLRSCFARVLREG